jgi:hypothetical protein
MNGEIRNLPAPGDASLRITGSVEDGCIVVRAGPEHAMERGVEVTRLDWRGHLHATEVHPSILNLIADTLARAIREARDRGYAQHQLDMRLLLGIKEPW